MKNINIINPKVRYCGYCGVETTLVEHDSYDTRTGRKNYELICNNQRCEIGEWIAEEKREDNCPKHEYPNGFLTMFGVKDQCKRCGEVPYLP